jgi:hypothetical protein
MLLTGLGGILLLGWCIASSNRYFAATRKAEGLDPAPSLNEIFSGLADEHLSALTRHQAEPKVETLRRRAWLAVAVWVGYMVLGYRVWAAIAGWLSW